MTIEERFWAKVDRTGDCWLWTGCVDKDGYGLFYSDRTQRAHRFAWELIVGPLPPDGLDHRHTCPKRCVNPGHLRPASAKQNAENLGAVRSNTGIRGVSWEKGRGRFVAHVKHNGKSIYVGRFLTIEEANAAVVAKRVELYKAVSAVARCFGNLANDMSAAGYTDAEAAAIKTEIAHYVAVREEVKLGAGENVDFKQYEPGMRFLLDTYIQADPSEVVADFEDTGLIELIVKLGAGAIDKLPKGLKKDKEAVAATIANNIRKVIIDEHAMNPKYYDKMSQLLDALIEQKRQGAIDYQQYLAKLIEQAEQLGKHESDTEYPAWANNAARRALIDFELSEEQATKVDKAIMYNKPDRWVGNPLKERRVKRAVRAALPDDFDRLDQLMDLIRARDEYR